MNSRSLPQLLPKKYKTGYRLEKRKKHTTVDFEPVLAERGLVCELGIISSPPIDQQAATLLTQYLTKSEKRLAMFFTPCKKLTRL